MSQAKIDAVLTPEIVMETGKKMRKALLATLTPQEVLDVLVHNEQVLDVLAHNEQVRQQVIASAPPEARLVGLTPEEMTALMAQIEAHLRSDKPEKDK
ncbi:MAG: hypothetical protein U0350_18915 [Caldilineaceae bacterium]